ncbi:MAG: hypothetical protein QM785_15720 [Pyrinomonadaceae bacterium]
MKVTFKRTKERAYSLMIEGPKIATAVMDPAPGYHERLPHDVAHFIVENELGIKGGIFGQMSLGGIIRPVEIDARIQRKAKRKREAIFKANEHDALFSEHAIWAAQSRWERHDIIPSTKISQADLDRVIGKFEEFANEWSRLPIGGSITLEWKHPLKPKTRKK